MWSEQSPQTESFGLVVESTSGIELSDWRTASAIAMSSLLGRRPPEARVGHYRASAVVGFLAEPLRTQGGQRGISRRALSGRSPVFGPSVTRVAHRLAP
jgi:hypothetical protein